MSMINSKNSNNKTQINQIEAFEKPSHYQIESASVDETSPYYLGREILLYEP